MWNTKKYSVMAVLGVGLAFAAASPASACGFGWGGFPAAYGYAGGFGGCGAFGSVGMPIAYGFGGGCAPVAFGCGGYGGGYGAYGYAPIALRVVPRYYGYAGGLGCGCGYAAYRPRAFGYAVAFRRPIGFGFAFHRPLGFGIAFHRPIARMYAFHRPLVRTYASRSYRHIYASSYTPRYSANYSVKRHHFAMKQHRSKFAYRVQTLRG
jgi:hypothetical protein